MGLFWRDSALIKFAVSLADNLQFERLGCFCMRLALMMPSWKPWGSCFLDLLIIWGLTTVLYVLRTVNLSPFTSNKSLGSLIEVGYWNVKGCIRGAQTCFMMTGLSASQD